MVGCVVDFEGGSFCGCCKFVQGFVFDDVGNWYGGDFVYEDFLVVFGCYQFVFENGMVGYVLDVFGVCCEQWLGWIDDCIVDCLENVGIECLYLLFWQWIVEFVNVVLDMVGGFDVVQFVNMFVCYFLIFFERYGCGFFG